MFRKVCANCKVEMIPLKNGVYLTHFMNNNRGEGIDEIQMGDLWGCPKCNAKIVAGLSQRSTLGLDIPNQNKVIRNLEEKELLIEIKR